MPESDPGDGEFDDDPFVIDFMRDLSNVGYDDAVVDIIGSGADVEHAEPSRDQELTDMLSAWRNDVDREPLNLDLPSDQTERGALPAWRCSARSRPRSSSPKSSERHAPRSRTWLPG